MRPAPPRPPRARSGPSAAAAALLAASLLAVAAPMAPARAQGVYTVEGVPADVTAEDAVAARERAIVEAQREGLRRLFAELAPPETPPAELPDASALPVEGFVRSYEIASEQVGARRYVGRLNVTYLGEPVRDALERAGIRLPGPPPAPTLVVPAVARDGGAGPPGLWWEAEAWRSALGAAAGGGTPPRFVLPLGDAADLAAFPPEAAAGGEGAGDAARELAARYGAGDVVVATLTPDPAGGAAAVELRGLVGRGAGASAPVPLDAAAGAGLDAAAAAALGAAPTLVRARPPAARVLDLAVRVELGGDLGAWLSARGELERAEGVRSVRVLRFARDAADVEVTYQGEPARLQEALGARGLALQPEEGGWRLQRADLAASAPASPDRDF